MNLEQLQARIELLQNEHQTTVGQLAALKDQMKKCKDHAQMLLGHLNEAIWHHKEVQNAQPAVPVPEAPPVQEEPVNNEGVE